MALVTDFAGNTFAIVPIHTNHTVGLNPYLTGNVIPNLTNNVIPTLPSLQSGIIPQTHVNPIQVAALTNAALLAQNAQFGGFQQRFVATPYGLQPFFPGQF